MRKIKVLNGNDAAALVSDGQTLVTSGYIGAGFPEHLVCSLAERFRCSGRPGELTLIHAAGQGDFRDRGLSELAQPGMLKRVIGGFFATAPAICDLIAEELVEAYSFPQGVLTHLFRNIAAGKPGVFSHIGLGTFVDPRIEGGRANEVTKEELVEVVQLGGKELLFYPAMPIDVAFIRGTTADLSGNLSTEREAASLEHLAIAQATRHCGGIVIAQVERIAEAGSLDPRRVKVPGNLVDAVVVAPPDQHWQTFAEPWNPALVGDIKRPLSASTSSPLTLAKVLARRAAMEMRPGDVVNMYHGPCEQLAPVALEEGLLEEVHLTVAAGAAGGKPQGGASYGLAENPDSILDQPSMFDFYHGGGLDLAVLPMIQVDSKGNVNVSKYGRTIKGCGSFIDVSQSARRLVFMGSHTIGAHIELHSGKPIIKREGRARRFVGELGQLTFSAEQARARGQQVLYITERAVFRLASEGLEVLEVAPGMDIKKDVLAPMAFAPSIADVPAPMASSLFRPEPMGLGREVAQ